MNRFWINIGLGVAAVVLLIIVIPQLAGGEKTPIRTLPYYMPTQTTAMNADASGKHIIRNFSFTDQTGKTLTNADFKGRITLVNFLCHLRRCLPGNEPPDESCLRAIQKQQQCALSLAYS
ncbi:MAG: hypothetical protein ACRC3B_21155 [Bacteroidia bacterium]